MNHQQPAVSVRLGEWLCVGTVIYFGLLLALPTLFWGFPSPTHDGELHQLWLRNFRRQLWDGELYPRWLLDMNVGRGSPAFFFYPPIPYYLTSLLGGLLPVLDDGHLLGWGASVALVASGLTSYRWLTRCLDRRAAVLGAILYMSAPYHLAVDLYQRGAFAEFWAFVWLPLLLLSAQGLAEGKGEPALAIVWAVLLMTHPPTAVMVGPLPLLWIAVMAERKGLVRALVLCGLSQVLGFGLAAIYLVPALTCQDHIQMETMHEGDMHYTYSFFFPFMMEGKFQTARSSFGAQLFPMMACGLIISLGAGLVALGFYRFSRGRISTVPPCRPVCPQPAPSCCSSIVNSWWHCRDAPFPRRVTLFWLGVTLAAGVLMTPLSACVYRLFPPLQLIQFPWRFGVVLVLGGAALGGLVFQALQRMGRARSIVSASLILSALTVSVPTIIAAGFGVRPVGDAAFSTLPAARHRIAPNSSQPCAHRGGRSRATLPA